MAPGLRLGVYDITSQLGEGGPPPLAANVVVRRELRRDRAFAQLQRTR